jgi:hypothetical protein
MEKSDPRDPRLDEEIVGKHPIFRYHNCWKCKDGDEAMPLELQLRVSSCKE